MNTIDSIHKAKWREFDKEILREAAATIMVVLALGVAWCLMVGLIVQEVQAQESVEPWGDRMFAPATCYEDCMDGNGPELPESIQEHGAFCVKHCDQSSDPDPNENGSQRGGGAAMEACVRRCIPTYTTPLVLTRTHCEGKCRKKQREQERLAEAMGLGRAR